jgi:hypothetical protein
MGRVRARNVQRGRTMMKSILFAFAATTLAFACGGGSGDGGSGVSGSKTLVSLSPSEVTQFCEYTIDVAGPERTVECGELDVTTGSQTLAECVADFDESKANAPNCPTTVSQAEACIEALADRSDAQICAFEIPAVCAPLFSEACQPSDE